MFCFFFVCHFGFFFVSFVVIILLLLLHFCFLYKAKIVERFKLSRKFGREKSIDRNIHSFYTIHNIHSYATWTQGMKRRVITDWKKLTRRKKKNENLYIVRLNKMVFSVRTYTSVQRALRHCVREHWANFTHC